MTAVGTIHSAQTWRTMKAQGWLDIVVFTSVSSPSGMPTEADLLGTGASPTTTNFTVDMRITDFRQRDIDAPRIMQGDRLARVPKATLTPTPGTRDYLTIATVRWEIQTIIERLDQAEWQFHIRRGSGAQVGG